MAEPNDIRINNDTRDRVIKAQAELDSLQKTLDDMKVKVDEMYSVMMQARGAQWLLLGTAALLGFMASLITKFLPLWASK